MNMKQKKKNTKTETERISPGEYERRYADACVKADVVPAPVRRGDGDEDASGSETEPAGTSIHLRGFCRNRVRGARGHLVRNS